MTDWSVDALCAQVGGEMFFPHPRDAAAIRAAKRICADCLVRAECLNEALAAEANPPGVCGGTSELERRRIRRAIKETKNMSINNGYPAPPSLPREERPHVCGKCRNPYTQGNPNCPNAPRPS